MPVSCPNCSLALPDWFFKQDRTQGPCPTCYSELTVQLFPALFRAPEKIEAAQLALGEEEACCFEHATKKAVALCSHCGRFLCGLCEVELSGKTFCPACIQSPQANSRVLETSRTLYDSIALALATWPLLFFYSALVTAPLTLFVGIRYWNRPSSIIPRTKWRIVLALVLATVEVGLLAFGIASLIFAIAATSRHGVKVAR